MKRPWQKRHSRYLGHYPVFNLREDIRVSPRTGAELPFYVLETPDWTNIIPLTPDAMVVMIHQYRMGTETVTLEIPGGILDRSDKTPIEAARREMLEETGYDSEDVHFIGSVNPNPAILNNTCHSYVAYNVELILEQKLDAGEDIHVELVPLESIPKLILNGTITNSLVLNAFYFLDFFQRNTE